MCSIKAKKLCGNCDICNSRAFVNNPLFIHISDRHKNEDLTQLTNGSHKKIWMKCPKSNHEFETRPNDIKKAWCPFPCCSNNNTRLCIDKYCEWCFKSSFASSAFVLLW